MVDLKPHSSLLEIVPINSDMQPFTGDSIFVRESVRDRLLLAAKKLAAHDSVLRLKVVYGFRHPTLQRRYYDARYALLQSQNPGFEPAALQRLTHQFVAVPDVAGHPTGAAVDVTLTRHGAELDMGTPLWVLDDAKRIPTFSEFITPEQRENRMLLRSVMMAAKFAPFDGEWWHFSYGDREWAAYYHKLHALYAPIDQLAN